MKTSPLIPLGGDDLYQFTEHVYSLLRQKGKKNNSLQQRMQRKEAARKLLQQTPCKLTNLQQLQTLHRLWRLVDQPQKAGELVRHYRETILQALASTGTEKIQTQLHLDFMQIQSDLHGDKSRGLQTLVHCAEMIKTLPAQLSGIYTQGYNQYSERYFFYCETNWQQYWIEWLELAKNYRAWELAQYGIEQRQAQNERFNENNEDQHWQRALTHIEQAYMARWHSICPEHTLSNSEYESLEQRVYHYVDLAITELGRAKSDKPSDYFSRGLQLAWRLMDEPIKGDPLLPQRVPDVIHAARLYRQQHVQAPPSCPIIQRYYEICEAQTLTTSYWFRDETQAALQIAKNSYFNSEDEEINDRFGSIYLSLLEQDKQFDALASIALASVLNIRPESAASAYIIAHRILHLSPLRYKQAPQTQAIWHLIMAWAAINPQIKMLIKENKLAAPSASRQESMAKVLALIPDNPIADLIEGWYLADKMRWAEALPLLERGIAQSPDYLLADNFIIKLWCARFAILPAKQALQRPWYLAGGAALNIHCAQQLLDADYLLEMQGIGSYWHRRYHVFLAPEDARILLAQYYFEAALKRYDHFIETPFECLEQANTFNFYDSLSPQLYFQLCQQLADIYRQQQYFDKAIILEKKADTINSFLAK